MKIILSRNYLFARLRTIGKIIKSKTLKSEFNSFLFEIKDGGLTITGCDDSGQITTLIECTIEESKDLRFLLDSSTLLNALKGLPEQPITFDIEQMDNSLRVIVRYQNGKYEMVGENVDLFPNMRKQVDAKQIVLNTETLSNGFKMLTFASKDDTLRPIMGTINLSSKDGTLAFAATSGYNLAIYEENIQLEEFNVNIPAKIAKIVSDLSIKNENVSIIFDETNIKFEVQDFIISYRLFEGRFQIIEVLYQRKIIYQLLQTVKS
ncbi:MAG: hypothetical protein ACOYEA_04880 [Fermentimonas sp.]|jgi:DNA polymerase-3 subunit beta